MKPKNITNHGCNPISSNCVDWEGGDLVNIKLCPDDNISTVIQKINLLLDGVKKQLNLSNLDISRIKDTCAVCPEPEKTLLVVLQLLINKVISIEDSLTPDSGTNDEDITLPLCLRENYNDLNGIPITKLPLKDFVIRIGQYLCNNVEGKINSINNVVNSILQDIINLEQQINLKNTDLSIDIPEGNCLVLPKDSTTGKTLVTKAMPVVLSKVCDINNRLGGESLMVGSLDIKIFSGDNSVIKLTSPTNTLLENGVADNVSDWMLNITAVVNDLRSAVRTIQQNCCQITCDDIVIDFDVKLSDDRTEVLLFFRDKTQLPNGFRDYNTNGTKLTITDSDGNSTNVTIKIADHIKNSIDSNGLEIPFTIDLTNTPIDPALDYYFTMDASITDGVGLVCTKCVNKTITYKNTCSYCTYNVVSNDEDTSSFFIINYKESGVSKFVTINANTSTVLPRNIQIISISYLGNVTLTSTCNNLDGVVTEQLTCNGFTFGITDGNLLRPFINVKFLGVILDNQEYLFTANNQFQINLATADITILMENAIKSNSNLSNLYKNVCANRYSLDSGRGGSYIVSFNTTETIAKKTQFMLEYTLFSGGKTIFNAPVKSRSILNTYDNEIAATCPCSNSTN